ncbi:hypothetical protein EIP91_007892 [Steccherinum ochraceum]|uniref:Uncharacterized protein n=1 Tax=Steccherinum ochraceum TaxID=92696 RepID=A0A4R0RNT5_9APHY|nr:hypothetical protein EIP91_007892 [Steccherinum ochraceum]
MLFAYSALSVLSVLAFTGEAQARSRWLERDGRAVSLYPRRFGEEHPAVIDKLASACGGGVCATLAGQAITPLLAAQPECSQQDMADQIIDTAQQFDATTKANMIALAQEYRQAEKNTPPDFTTNPPTNRNSVFCQTAPKNPELNGLVQAQDPANDPNIFFDPATQASVKKGSQANTFPFGTNSSSSGNSSSSTATSTVSASVSSSVSATVSATASGTVSATSSAPSATTTGSELDATDPGDDTATCPPPRTVTVTGTANPLPTGPAVTVTAGSSIPLIPAPTSTAALGNFGSCTLPQIEFATGFDNRKETSFQPTDKTSYNHGSAQNIDIITQFMCDTLVNSCGADKTAQSTCATAKAAADTAPAKTGAQADAFNAVFGISTSFSQVPAVDDLGNVIPGSTSDAGSGSSSASASVSTSVVASATATGTASATVSATSTAATATSTAAAGSGSSGSNIGNFGSCSVPQIEFATGFDGRKETSFQPTDKTSYNHGSAQGIDIITQFMCDTLTNSCKADQTAKDTCKQAQTAADGQAAKTGAQADAFNAVFGIKTNFAAVAVVDDQGRVVSGGAAATATPGSVDNAQPSATAVASSQPPAATASSASAPSATASSTAAASATTSAPPAAQTSAASATAPPAGNLQTFTGALGGVKPPAVTALANGQFQVDGNSAFKDVASALTRSCDVQHNQCANAANASGNKGDLTVAACGDQQTQCDASH